MRCSSTSVRTRPCVRCVKRQIRSALRSPYRVEAATKFSATPARRNPALRPLAASATPRASRTTTRAPRFARKYAVATPAIPAPTTATSADVSPSSGGYERSAPSSHRLITCSLARPAAPSPPTSPGLHLAVRVERVEDRLRRPALFLVVGEVQRAHVVEQRFDAA